MLSRDRETCQLDLSVLASGKTFTGTSINPALIDGVRFLGMASESV